MYEDKYWELRYKQEIGNSLSCLDYGYLFFKNVFYNTCKNLVFEKNNWKISLSIYQKVIIDLGF